MGLKGLLKTGNTVRNPFSPYVMLYYNSGSPGSSKSNGGLGKTASCSRLYLSSSEWTLQEGPLGERIPSTSLLPRNGALTRTWISVHTPKHRQSTAYQDGFDARCRPVTYFALLSLCGFQLLCSAFTSSGRSRHPLLLLTLFRTLTVYLVTLTSLICFSLLQLSHIPLSS